MWSASSSPDSTSSTSVVETDLGEVEILAHNLEAPWSFAFADHTTRISERDSSRSSILAADGNTRAGGGVGQAVADPGEGGPSGIALHEDQLYTYLTTGADERISRYNLLGGPGAYELGSPQEL